MRRFADFVVSRAGSDNRVVPPGSIVILAGHHAWVFEGVCMTEGIYEPRWWLGWAGWHGVVSHVSTMMWSNDREVALFWWKASQAWIPRISWEKHKFTTSVWFLGQCESNSAVVPTAAGAEFQVQLPMPFCRKTSRH